MPPKLNPQSLTITNDMARRYFDMRAIAATACALVIALGAGAADAQSTIRQPGARVMYSFELEPHVAFGVFDPPGRPIGSGIGFGLRAAIPIIENGFVRTINNSIAISFGLDWLYYYGSALTVGRCARTAPSGGGLAETCVDVDGPIGGTSHYVYIPTAMQWNFWLSDTFSVFGEPGTTIYYEKGRFEERGHLGLRPLLQVGGRWHFARRAMLTLRVGYPTQSLGVSMVF